MEKVLLQVGDVAHVKPLQVGDVAHVKPLSKDYI